MKKHWAKCILGRLVLGFYSYQNDQTLAGHENNKGHVTEDLQNLGHGFFDQFGHSPQCLLFKMNI